VSNPPDWSPRDGVPDYMVGIDLLFTLAVALDLLGVLDINVGLEMVVLIPGFLFEFKTDSGALLYPEVQVVESTCA
jgi:hypothetical protein